MTVAESTVASDSGAPARRRDLLGWFRNPLTTFLLLGVTVGVYLVCVVPHFGGIDEPAHFYRSYQISTGTFLPEKFGKSGFSGACTPRDVVLTQLRDSSVYAPHVLNLDTGRPAREITITPNLVKPCPTDPSEGFVTFSTFGSPVPYLPQAGAIFVVRELGFGADAMLLAARFTVLFVYLAIVGVAIARSPRSKWAIATVGLLPVALFQAAPSVSHDAFTTAVAVLVVSSALRALDPPPGTSTRALVIEAVVLSAVLGMCKPMYVVVALLYLLPLIGRRRRRDEWPLVLAPIVGIAVTVLWNVAVGDLWKTDAGYFGIKVDDTGQKHELLHAPWDFAGDLLRTVWHHAWDWPSTLVAVGPSVTKGPAILAVIALAVYAGCSLQRARSEAPAPLDGWQRALILVALLAGVVLVAGANYVYWTNPGRSQINGIQPRYFMPLVVLLPVAIGSLPWKWADTGRARVPIPALLAPTLVVFCVLTTFRMY